MKINYLVKNIKLSGELQKLLETKIKKFSRFSNKIWQIRVDLRYNPSYAKKKSVRLEINLHMPDKVLQAVAEGEDLRETIDLIEGKIKKQLEKYKKKDSTKRRIARRLAKESRSI